MSNAYSDATVTKLRAIVDTIDREIVDLPGTATLRVAWAKIVEVLALGPAPQTRVCPTCESVGFRAASRCGNCWAKLELLPPVTEAAPPGGDA